MNFEERISERILSDGLDQMVAIVYDSAENAPSYVGYTEKSR